MYYVIFIFTFIYSYEEISVLGTLILRIFQAYFVEYILGSSSTQSEPDATEEWNRAVPELEQHQGLIGMKICEIHTLEGTRYIRRYIRILGILGDNRHIRGN